MILNIDLESNVPINQQLYESVVVGIATGALKAGCRLPSTRELAKQFGINFHTVNKAYSRLCNDGFIRLSRRIGAVILKDGVAPLEDEAFLDDLRRRLRLVLAEATAHGISSDEALLECQRILHSFREKPFIDSGRSYAKINTIVPGEEMMKRIDR